MWKKVLLAVVGLLVVIGIIGGMKGAQIGALINAGKSFVPPPLSVTSAKVTEEEWQPRIKAVGTVVARHGVTVSTEVPGLVKTLDFDSGQRVKKGDVLVRLDSSIERAQLASAEASLDLAEVSLKRTQALAKERINTQSELDSAEATSKQAQAQVDNLRAQIAKKTVRAPFDGELGIRQVELGQILRVGDPVVSLQSLEQVYVDFYLPQKDLGRVHEGQAVHIDTDARPGKEWSGTIDTIEPSVEESTRNVRLRAVFANPEGDLRPGLFVEVRVDLPSNGPVLVVPVTAVVYQPYGNSIFVIEDAKASAAPAGAKGEGDKEAAPKADPAKNGHAEKNGHTPAKQVRQIFVELGQRRGDFIEVKSGVEKGAEIVSSGGFKLSNGNRVEIHNEDGLSPELNPTPKDS